jgi:hypothetical protein
MILRKGLDELATAGVQWLGFEESASAYHAPQYVALTDRAEDIL